MNSKTIICKVLLIFILSQSIVSQEKMSLRKDLLWLHNTTSIENQLFSTNENLFNFNSIIDANKNEIVKKLKSIVKDQSTIIIVYKSDYEDERALLTIEKPLNGAIIDSKNLINETTVKLNKGNPKNGTILSYFMNLNNFFSNKKGDITINEIIQNKSENKFILLELIYIPKIISDIDKVQIESYLSFKHGISLSSDSDYYNSKNKKIWNHKDSENFNNRVTAIGRDDYFELNQKQSGNSYNDGLYLSIGKFEKSNFLNKSQFDNLSFIIWGDNNKSNVLKYSEDYKVKKMEKQWKIKNISETSYSTQLMIEKKVLSEKSDSNETDLYWMVIDTINSSSIHYFSSKYIKSDYSNKDAVFFNNQIWKQDSSNLFSFIKAPDFFAITEATQPKCIENELGKIDIRTVGGVAPFSIKIFSNNGYVNNFTTSEFITLKGLENGTYEIEIKDSMGKTTINSVELYPSFKNYVNLLPTWYLENGSVIVTPDIKEINDVSIKWMLGNNLVSSEKSFNATKEGNYKMIISSSTICQMEFPFSVSSNKKYVESSNEWTVYPNPVKSDTPFKINFAFEKPTKTYYSIYDANGKLIKQNEIGIITKLEKEEALRTAGTYFIVVNKDSVAETAKIIIE